jgi:hypothetical protein
MRGLHNLFAACLLAAGLGLAASHAHAQSDVAPPGYDALVDRGLSESAAGRWLEARAAFREAHGLHPNARTLRGMGMASFEARDYVDAVRQLRLSLAATLRALTDEQRTQVEALLQQCRGLVGSYTTAHLPPGTAFAVDGVPLTPEADGTLLLGMGPHRVQLHADGQHGAGELNVRGGEYAALPIELDAPRAASEPEPVSDSEPEPVPEPVPGERTSRLPAQLTTFTGLAVLGVGVGLLIAGLTALHEVEDAPAGTEWSTLEAANDRAPLLTGIGGALIGVGAAATLGGSVWWIALGARDERLSVGLRVRGTL